MDYIKARTYIDESHRFGGEMGLEAITCLLEKLGNPQETLQFIHNAGTNGKGSVGAYLAAVLQEAGYRIGRFISPTLYEYRERIQINGVYIEEEGMAYRGTFVVNPEGKIKVVELNDNNIGRDASELLRKVEAAQFVATHDGEVCPAKWKKGESTLKPSIDLVGKI